MNDLSILHWLNDAAPYGIFTTDADLNIQTWNRWMEENSARRAADLVGQNLFNLYPDLGARKINAFYENVLRGQSFHFTDETTHYYLLGMPPSQECGMEFMPQNARIAPLIENGNVIGTITLIEDMTARVLREAEHKQTEEALKQERDLNDAIINTVGAMIVVLDREGGIVRFNHTAEIVTGSLFEDVIGLPAFNYIYPPDQSDFFQRLIREQLADFPGAYESELIARDKTTRSILWSNTVIESQGEAAYLIASGIDITKRKQAEEQAQHRAEQLAAVNDLGRALGETLDLEQVYKHVHTAIKQLLPDIAAFFISRYDNANQTIHCMYGVQDEQPIDPRQLPPLPLSPPNSGTQSQVIRTRQPLIAGILPDQLQATAEQVLRGAVGKLAQSALYVPMITKADIIGVMQVQSYTPNRFTLGDADLLSMVANAAAIAIENARLFIETERRLRHLQTLQQIDSAISASTDLRVTLNVLLERAIEELHVDAASVLLLQPDAQTIAYAEGRGFRSNGIRRLHLRIGEGFAGRATFERRIIHVADLNSIDPSLIRAEAIKEEGFQSYYAVPLICRGQVKGVLDIFYRSRHVPDDEWLNFLEALGTQAAIAIDNSSLLDRLQQLNVELMLAYDATIEGWSRALDLRDKETEGHTLRVTAMTEKLAKIIGVHDAELIHLRRGSLLHDIGKMGIPDSILLKPGALDDDEWAIMRQHPIYAYNMLKHINYLSPALNVPLHHHEKWDGSGYPHGLKGEQIPLAARIFAIADVWDALTYPRPYRTYSITERNTC
ncbi:MAG: GAF domain-containing protein [Chloroflexi bacterium]|nr:GAF domain-containing protein [Chloroflexota bacterium]